MDPIPPWLQRLLDTWDLRVMILFSLALQIILIGLGGRRKYVNGIWIDIVIWAAYLMADYVASVSLGKLSDFTSTMSSDSSTSNGNNKVSPDNPVMALWAALFLLHLGGPDTITAFSVQDVQLWLRHALGLLIHVALVLYIFLRCWTASGSLSAFNFFMFVAGVIKYTERSWALYSANSMFPRPFLPISRENEDSAVVLQQIGKVQDVNLFAASYIWLQNMSALVFAGLQRVDRGNPVIVVDMYGKSNRESMFKFIETVLGFMYDAIHTKATRIYTISGFIFRIISIVCIFGMLVAFVKLPKHRYSNIDIVITYVLLFGAVVLEIYALMLIICSEWTIVWMAKYYNRRAVRHILQILVPLTVGNLRRWSGSAQQMNLVNLLLYDLKKPRHVKITKLFRVDKEIKKYTCRTNVPVPKELKKLMIEGVKRTLEELGEGAAFTQRGELALKHQGISDKSVLRESIRRDFNESLVIWHVVTDYCYHQEINNPSESDRTRDLRSTSKFISDYMMYLLVGHSYMLNIIQEKVDSLLENGMKVVRKETSYFGQDEEKIRKLFLRLLDEEHFDGLSQTDQYKLQENSGTEDLIRSLLGREFNTGSKQWTPCRDLIYSEGDNPSSVAGRKDLYERTNMKLCLAGHLADTMVTGEYGDSSKRWEIINQVWMEMLFHGAAHCQVSHHLDQLRRGGELLTHVWLLLTIHGLTDANRIVGGVLRSIAQQAIKNPVNDWEKTPDGWRREEEEEEEEDKKKKKKKKRFGEE